MAMYHNLIARAFLFLVAVGLVVQPSRCASLESENAAHFHSLGMSPAVKTVDEQLSDRTVSSAQERLFALVKFRPEVCEISPTGAMGVGTCTTSTDCMNRGGSNIGSCAKGFGTCCLLTLSATPQNPIVNVRDRAVIIENGNGATASTFEFQRLEGSCQLLVEFITFTLLAPNLATGMCTEAMRISGSSTVATGFTICGTNTGQRIFLSYGRQERITMDFTTPTGRFSLRVRHILCSNTALLAPNHCLQHYTTSTGIVRSFSYGNSMTTGQRYTVCIQDPNASGAIEWLECVDGDAGFMTATSQFSLSNYFLQKTATTPPIRMGMTGFPCETTSFVEVFGEYKHCGGKFTFETANGQTPVRSLAKPFQLFVNTAPNSYALPTLVPALTMAVFHYPAATGATNPPVPVCTALGGTTGGQGFGTCTGTDTAHICTCPLAAAGTIIEPNVPPRTGFCLKYMLTS